MLRYFLNEYFTLEFFLLSLVKFILDHYHSFIKCIFSALDLSASQRLVSGYHMQMYSWTNYRGLNPEKLMTDRMHCVASSLLFSLNMEKN